MSHPQKLFSAGKNQRKLWLRGFAYLSIALLLFANFLPELSGSLASLADDGTVSTQSPTSPPGNRYIFVNKAASDDFDSCTIQTAGSDYPSTTGICDLKTAIEIANNDTAGDTISIIFANTIASISIGTPLPALDRVNNGQLVIDGLINGAQKVILREVTRSTPTLNYFFRIASTNGRQAIKIRNFAFTQLKADESTAILTDDRGTPSMIESADISALEIYNNYFGTENGLTPNTAHSIENAINLTLPTGTSNSVGIINIYGNNFYNVRNSSIFIGSSTPDGQECELNTHNSGVNIYNNTIGLSKSFTIDTGTGNGGAWSGSAIRICNQNNVTIRDNQISNSIKTGSKSHIGIVATASEVNILRNSIGTTPATEASSIIGYGIAITHNYANYDGILGTRPKSYIYGNTIQNIKAVPAADQEDACSDFSEPSERSMSCGGAGLGIIGSSANWIYGNTIGNKDFPNGGYGIQLEGFSGVAGIGVSAHNKIFSNTISYNSADGIHIENAYSIDSEDDEPDYFTGEIACTGANTITGEQAVLNNCFNTISENQVFRNGAFNSEASVIAAFSNEGGIGIDLKSSSDQSEQKYGADPYTGSGTFNDVDLSENDTSDSDLGGNGVLNYPRIEPFDSENTASGSTLYEIRGDLNDNSNGKYWVEVFSIECPADGVSTAISSTNAFENCDTDSVDETAQSDYETSGQGKQFLCGAFVNKTATATSDDWSCKPNDFTSTVSLPAQALVTATATKLISNMPLTAYSTGTPTTTLPGSFLDAHAQYNCALAKEFLSNLDGRCGGLAEQSTGRNFNDYEYFIMQGLGDTSEFSRAAFLPPSLVNISTTVRACNSLTTTDCTGPFSSDITSEAGDIVEYRIDIQNNTTEEAPLDVPSILSNLASGITFQNATCQIFIDQETLPATSRPSTGAVNCSSYISGQNLLYEPTTVPTFAASNHVIVYILGSISSSAAPGAYNNRASIEIKNYCDSDLGTVCESTAIVNIVAPAALTITKEIRLPNTNSDTSTETITSSSSSQTVDYRITANFTGLTFSQVANYAITDNFPREIRTGKVIAYQNCTYQIFYSDNTDGGSGPCDNASSINSTNTTDLAIWSGSHFPDTASANAGLQVVINYQAVIPAEALTSGDTNRQIINTAEWTGPHGNEANRSDSTTLTIAAPSASGPIPTLTKTVTPAEITLGTSAQTVTYTVRLVKSGSDSFPAFSWTDTFPTMSTTGTPFSIAYSNCQVTVDPVGSSTVPCTSPFPDSINRLTTGAIINAATQSITFTYTATIQPTTITSAQTLTNSTTFIGQSALGNKPEITRETSLIIRPATTPTGTAVPSFTKRANNNVTSASRTTETIYKPGDTVSYTISLSNSGSAPAASVAISDTLPGNLSTPTIDTVTGLVASVANRIITSTPFTLATGTNRASIVYHATLADRTDYDLSDADLDTEADPTDDDFFIDDNAEIDADIASRGNAHRDEDDLVGAPDGKPLSLGDDGSVIIDLGDKLIVNGTGNDFGVVALTRLADNTDGDTSRYQVSVSQDGVTFTNIGDDDNTETQHFDLRRVRLPWIKFIQITDKSSSVKGSAPGADIDAVCLFNIGVEEINQAALTYNGTTLRTAAPIVVDVTSTFDDEPDSDNCAEQEIKIADTPAPLPSAPLDNLPPPPPTIVEAVVPPPPSLPKTGAQALAVIVSTGVAVFIKRTWFKQ